MFAKRLHKTSLTRLLYLISLDDNTTLVGRFPCAYVEEANERPSDL